MDTEKMILIRRIVTPVSCGLILLGLGLLDPVLALSIYAVIGLFFGTVFFRAWRRSKSRPRPTEAEEIESVKRFIHSQRRWDIFQFIFIVYLVGVLYWVEGFTAPTVLTAFGGTLLSAERLLVEPRIWAAMGREHGFSLS